MIEIGGFKITSGKMVIVDPLRICVAFMEHVKRGTWVAFVERVAGEDWMPTFEDEQQQKEYVSKLVVCHESVAERDGIKYSAPFYIRVDSAKVGFFDMERYHDNYIYDNGLTEIVDDKATHFKVVGDDFYTKCYEATANKNEAGVIPYGVVSSSGYGSGTYCCYTSVDEDGAVVKAMIEFM